MGTSDPLKIDKGWVRYIGILTGIALVVLVFALYILPRRAGFIVGAFAALMVAIGGARFIFDGSTIISMSLDGWRRTWFQVAIALAVPVGFVLILASCADAVPLATLWRMLTPWLLIPLGIIAWVSWYFGGHLNRDHPFRGFLIAATVLGVLCFLWSAGMVSESDYEGEDSSFFFDPEKARVAKETGEYVWRFALYVTTAYLGLLFRLKLRSPPIK